MQDESSSDLEHLLQLPEATLQRRFVASLIDEQGREVAITETMVHDACQALEQDYITGLHCPMPAPTAPER